MFSKITDRVTEPVQRAITLAITAVVISFFALLAAVFRAH